MPTLIDTHAHLDDEQFEDGQDELVRRASEAGVETIIAVGCTVESSRACIRLAERFPEVRAAVGIQPNYCGEIQEGDWEKIVALSSHPRVAAIGETGLDRYWDRAPFAVQQDYFRRHMELARRRDLPFIVHMRDCGDDILEALRSESRSGPLRGVMHSYTGDDALADQCLELGMFISFAGMVTYKKSDELRATARRIPADRILIETDAPYLSPHPKRKQHPNEPALLAHTAACLAETRGEPLDEFAAQTTANARELFAL